MRSLLAIPAASLALVAAHPHTFAITSSEAAGAMTARIHKQVASRLRAGFSGETLCSGSNAGQKEINSSTELPRWRCTLELRGARFPSPCKAEAYVLAIAPPHRARVEWLAMSRYCREGPG